MLIPMQHSQAFTLLEMLIVVALIAILIAIAYPSYRAHLQRAQRQQARVDLHALAARLEDYYGTHGRYPNSLQQLGNSQDVLATHNHYRFKLISNGTSYQLQAQTNCSTLSLDNENRLNETNC